MKRLEYQEETVDRFTSYLETLVAKRDAAEKFAELARQNSMEPPNVDWCGQTWDALKASGVLPKAKDAQGNLFGSTTQGPGGGGGTFFELTPSNGSWSFNTMYSLSGWGISGEFRTAYLDPSDNIFGTTHCDGQYSSGSVYELQRSGSTYNYVDLYDFTGGTDGQYVFSNPAFDTQGDIFGTANVGGSGYGVVWEVRAADKNGRRHV